MKGYILFDFIYTMFSKGQSYKEGEQICIFQGTLIGWEGREGYESPLPRIRHTEVSAVEEL